MHEFDLLLLTSRWLHIGAAMVAIGGMAFLRLALLPGSKEVLDEQQQEQLREAVRVRWARVVAGCIVLLLLTGSINFLLLAIPPKVEPMPYHGIFGIKFLSALVVFFLASALMGRSPGLANIRKQSAKWLSVMLGLAALIVLLSGVLNQIRTRPGEDVAAIQPLPE